MKLITATLLLSFSFLMIPAVADAAVWVNGYYRSNGTYVSGHYRSEPNGLKYDNYSWSYGDSLYNDSYYDIGRTSNWYTPSYSWDTDYYTGYNYNTDYLGSSYNNPYLSDYNTYNYFTPTYSTYDYLSW